MGNTMAVAEKPSLIIADEPTSALDATIQAEIVDLLDELRRSLRSSIILITHDLALLTEIADRIMVMYAGKVVEIADRESIVSEPKHPYTRGLMESIKYDRKARLKAIKGSVPSLIDPPRGCRFVTRCPLADRTCWDVEPKLRNIASSRKAACHKV